jgi:hypothetical protein
VVQVMLRSPGLRVVSFSQADAYLRRFPFLSKVVLPRGVVDLVRDVPPRDTVLLATTANVIVRDDLHPALASLLLQAMTEVNGKGGFFQRAGEFPAYKDQSFPLSSDAARYYKSGPPFLQRYLPFWLAVLVERLFVMILPLVMLSAAAAEIRAGDLQLARTLEDRPLLRRPQVPRERPAPALRPADAQEYVAHLERIENDASTLNIPLAFSDLLYTLREHINLVREELLRLATTMTRTTRNEILPDCESKGGFREIDAGDQSGRSSRAQRPSGDAR